MRSADMEKILIVDDSPLQAAQLKSILDRRKLLHRAYLLF